MKTMLTTVLCCIFALSTLAQRATQEIHQEVANQIKTLFNDKQFAAIYGLCTKDFKKQVSQKELVGLLEKGMYNPMGKITSASWLTTDSAYMGFALAFDNDKLLLNLGVDASKQINFLQILPYKAPPPAFKRNVYLSDNPMQTALDSLVERTVESYMRNPYNSGLCIAVSHKGKNYFYNYGEVVKDSKQATSVNTLFEIGSITKTFCGTLLAHAVLEKKIDLEDDVRKYLPGNYPALQFKGKPVLIKHLVNHTSGLQSVPANIEEQPHYNARDPYRNYSRSMMLEYLRKTQLATLPGATFDYSNFGMALLGIVLEEVYKKSFDELVKEKICVPIEMPNTAQVLNATQEQQLASGYSDSGEPTPHWLLNDFAAAGGLRSNTKDMLAYLNYHLEEKDEATRLCHQSTFKNGRDNVAMSWFIKQTKLGNNLIWHNGGTYGFSSFCGFMKEKNFALVVLSNSGTNVDFAGIALINYLQK